MRMRAALGIVVAALMLVGTAGQAGAAPAPVEHLRTSGARADAVWATQSTTSFEEFGVFVSRTREGSQLDAYHFVGQTDADGVFLGGVETVVRADRGSDVAIDSSRLSSARVSGSGLQATRCVYDADGNTVGACTTSTVDVAVVWTGSGPISRGTVNERVRVGGERMNLHITWTSRDASAAGSFAGLSLDPSTLQFASIGTEKQVKSGR